MEQWKTKRAWESVMKKIGDNWTEEHLGAKTRESNWQIDGEESMHNWSTKRGRRTKGMDQSSSWSKRSMPRWRERVHGCVCNWESERERGCYSGAQSSWKYVWMKKRRRRCTILWLGLAHIDANLKSRRHENVILNEKEHLLPFLTDIFISWIIF